MGASCFCFRRNATNFSGHSPHPTPRFLGVAFNDNPIHFPMGVAPVCKNCRFLMESVAQRYGLARTMSGASGRVTGLGVLNYIGAADTDTPLVFDSAGNLFKESPVGSGTLVPVGPWFEALPVNAYAQMTSYANRAWMAFTDLKAGVSNPAVFSGLTGNFDPISSRLFGESWAKSNTYVVGDVVTPSTPNGYFFRCTVAGTSSATTEPVWPTSGTITDNGITWTEATPVIADSVPVLAQPTIARVGGAGTFAVGKDVYIKTTLVNPIGETDSAIQTPAVIVNTVLNDRVRVTSPTLIGWVNALGGSYKPTSYNVYEATVATGAAAPLPTDYKLVTNTALGVATNVDTTAVGAVAPQVSSAAVAPVGNVGIGTKYYAVMFRYRSGQIIQANKGYISGYRQDALNSFNVDIAGRQLYYANMPTGAANCVERIVAFGLSDDPAGAGATISYIPEDFNSGVANTKTVIGDNVTTSGYFNFDETYLGQLAGGETDVTDFYLKMRVPACKDISYIPSLDRMAYLGAVGYESSILFSERGDPETIYGTGSELGISAQDGERTVKVWEVKAGEILCWKDNSVHAINPIPSVDPAGWNTVAKSRKAGACGPRAVDCGTEFAIAAHRSGIWKYDFQDMSYTKISDEIGVKSTGALNTNSWEGVNWDAQHLIWVTIDETQRVVRIGVPYGTSTVPNKVFTVDYKMGWDPAVVINMFGKLMASHHSRKWSGPDDIQAHSSIIADRTLVTPVDQRINERQVLYASSVDGCVRMEVPDIRHDDDAAGSPVAIDQQYQTAYAQDESGKILSLKGLSAQVTGVGAIAVKPVTEDDADSHPYHAYEMNTGKSTFIADGARGQNQYWSYLFRNCDLDGNPIVDSGFELNEAVIFADPAWPGRQA